MWKFLNILQTSEIADPHNLQVYKVTSILTYDWIRDSSLSLLFYFRSTNTLLRLVICKAWFYLLTTEFVTVQIIVKEKAILMGNICTNVTFTQFIS